MYSETRSYRNRLIAMLGAAAVACAAAAASAQPYPSRTVEFIVHTNPGGGTDVFARVVTEIMTRDKLVSQPLVVQSRTGGAGVIAFTYAKGKRGDPHTVLTIATGSFLTAAARTDLDLGLEHFTPLAFFARDPQGIIVNADSKYRTFKDLLDDAKGQPDSIVGAVTSATGTARMTLWRMERETGAKFKFVTFKAGSEAVLSVLGGHVPFTTEQRMPALPDVPTLIELGYKIQIGTGRGFVMPAGVPKDAVAVMEALLEKVHKSARWREYAVNNLYEDRWMGSAEFARYLAEQRVAQREFVEGIGLSKKP